MWNRAEENADALREAFEAAAERAAEEAERATADALARAEQEHKGARGRNKNGVCAANRWYSSVPLLRVPP